VGGGVDSSASGSSSANTIQIMQPAAKPMASGSSAYEPRAAGGGEGATVMCEL
jgi:hypothetical protein